METPPKPAMAPARVINVHGVPQEFHGEFASDLPGMLLAAGGYPGAFPETLPGDFDGNFLCFRPFPYVAFPLLSSQCLSSHFLSFYVHSPSLHGGFPGEVWPIRPNLALPGLLAYPFTVF